MLLELPVLVALAMLPACGVFRVRMVGREQQLRRGTGPVPPAASPMPPSQVTELVRVDPLSRTGKPPFSPGSLTSPSLGGVGEKEGFGFFFFSDFSLYPFFY